MKCIFCCEERDPSLEHVLALAIGGTVTTDRVCEPCNSDLGSRVDAALSDFMPIRSRRAELGLAGNSGSPPSRFEMFVGEATLAGSGGKRIRTSFNERTGRLEHRQIYHVAEVLTPDGQKDRQITIDARDRDQIPVIIQRERKRRGLPPLSDVELAERAARCPVTTIDKPCIMIPISVSFAYLRHAMIKIAYELAFLWLGEEYLSDPFAVELRAAVCDKELTSTDQVVGQIGFANESDVFNRFWTPDAKHHLAFASVVPQLGGIVISVRIFDIYSASVLVSREPQRYIRNAADRAKLRFLSIDSVTGRTINTTFDEESHRMASAMTAYRRTPPFPDPLTVAGHG